MTKTKKKKKPVIYRHKHKRSKDNLTGNVSHPFNKAIVMTFLLELMYIQPQVFLPWLQ